jgi:hypothetical protein
VRKNGKIVAIQSKLAGNPTAAASQLQPHCYALQPGILFVAQGDHRIDLSRAPHRDAAGDQDYSHQQCGDRQKDLLIFGVHAVEQARHEMRYKQSGEQTDGDT